MQERIVGGYRLVAQIGYGGMSTVFAAEDEAGNRVALKLLNPAMVSTERGRERLQREVHMLQKVRGPFVAEVLDAETEENEAFIVTELIEGPTLEEDVRRGGIFTEEDLAELGEQLAEAVRQIHAAGVLHRDLKPSNVMMSERGPVLIDFGIAQLDEDSRLTQTGFLSHTPGYCDPRIINGASPDEDADWWALAAILAFAATGEHPFGTGSSPAVMNRVLTGKPTLPDLPPALAMAFSQALAPRPVDRLSFFALLRILRDPDSLPHEWQTRTLRTCDGTFVDSPLTIQHTYLNGEARVESTEHVQTSEDSVPTRVGVTSLGESSRVWSEESGGDTDFDEPGQVTPYEEWMRPLPRSRFLIVSVGALLVSLALVRPTWASFIYILLSFLAANVGAGYSSLMRKRREHGRRLRAEGVYMTLRAPWLVLVALISCAVSCALGGSLAATLLWMVTRLGGALSVGHVQSIFALVVAVFFFISWVCPTNSPARIGARVIARSLAPSVPYRAFWCLVLLVAALGCALYAVGGGISPQWSPLSEPGFLGEIFFVLR